MQKLVRTVTVSNNYTREAEQKCLVFLNDCNNFSKLTQIQTQIIKLGLTNNPLVLTRFTSASSDLQSTEYASSFIFSPDSDTRLYDTFLFNTFIRAYAQSNFSKVKAVSMYKLMLEFNVVPNKFTYPFVLKACAGVGCLSLGKSVHGLVLKVGLDHDRHVKNTLVRVYCCGVDGVEFARKVFDEMCERDCVSWSAMIGGYARLGMCSDAIGLFREMQVEGGCRPDEVTMVAVLSACSNLGALELGKWVELYIEMERVQKSVELCNALVDMFAKCGEVDKAINLFRNMKERSIISWTSVIVGFAMHGRGLEAVGLFEEMIESGVVPDDVAFIGLLSACSHSGLVDKGRMYFDLMTKNFSIEPKIEHYGCMVDMLCRAGLVNEALEFVRKMPIEPNAVVCRTLINGCRAHGKLKLGETITRELIRNEPMHESNYVLLSQIYAKMFNWEKKMKIRELMDKKGMKKIPGSTMIELGNEIYEFVVGDKSHEQNKEIYEMVDEMGRKMKQAGYVQITSEVLLDIDDEFPVRVWFLDRLLGFSSFLSNWV
ncbi:pentatricopeptide repeat-containing protein At5g48910-like [Mercurialis annua]|uniref:pentatricopeptide repeat-containing protein At5g48910-like n=1 Tax=Mercurialis annua TaxID=3986 RepID=UPI002160416F|nr:pentatricopeptide repeat-containing protein At5g48910-like [Mercurialis annua]